MQPTKMVATRTEGDWIGIPAKSSHANTVARVPFDLYDETGALIAIGRRGVCTPNEMLYLHEQLRATKYSKARRTNGMLSRSAVYGFMPRDGIRRNYCRCAALMRQRPRFAIFLEELGKRCSEVLKTEHPEQYFAQEKLVASISDTWRMPDSIFTSGIINLNNPLVYHRDQGNFSSSWNAMMVARRSMAGGELILPEYGLSIEFKDGDIVWMDAAANPHGVTQMIPQREGGYRISLVWYALKDLARCGTPKEELLRIQQLKTKIAGEHHSSQADKLRKRIKKNVRKPRDK